jgi:hypothetical protein
MDGSMNGAAFTSSWRLFLFLFSFRLPVCFSRRASSGDAPPAPYRPSRHGTCGKRNGM